MIIFVNVRSSIDYKDLFTQNVHLAYFCKDAAFEAHKNRGAHSASRCLLETEGALDDECENAGDGADVAEYYPEGDARDAAEDDSVGEARIVERSDTTGG